MDGQNFWKSREYEVQREVSLTVGIEFTISELQYQIGLS